jgi:formiminotetrahydrofolate cyclodeaminase
MYKDGSLARYLEDLSARLPAPGGGSAAALSAGLGAALISMVVHFTIGKPQYAPFEKELKEVLAKSEKLRQKFLDLVDLDVVAYKSKNMQDALNIPFMVCRLCYEGIKLCPPLIKKGNVNLISDVSVAAILLEDEALARSMRKELTGKSKLIRKIRTDTEVKVGKIIRG